MLSGKKEAFQNLTLTSQPMEPALKFLSCFDVHSIHFTKHEEGAFHIDVILGNSDDKRKFCDTFGSFQV